MNQRHKLYAGFAQWFFLISLLFLTQPAFAEEDGRYRAIVLHDEGRSGQPGGLFPKVFIIDSKKGHMWTWEEKKKIKSLKDNFTFGTVITYQGRVKPGGKMGEIVEQSVGR